MRGTRNSAIWLFAVLEKTLFLLLQQEIDSLHQVQQFLRVLLGSGLLAQLLPLDQNYPFHGSLTYLPHWTYSTAEPVVEGTAGELLSTRRNDLTTYYRLEHRLMGACFGREVNSF